MEQSKALSIKELVVEVKLIQEISKMQGIDNCDEQLTFFYDETGNCGKFSLRENGVNDPTALYNDFILGGVAYVGEESPVETESLIKALNIRSDELKFKNIYKTKDFISFLNSKKASVYIDWLYKSGLLIHYATINNLYYALVDLVDSLWDSQPQFLFSQNWVLALKSSLYNFCKEHLAETLTLLYRYNYPNIERERTQSFCCDFCSFIQTCNDEASQQGFLIESFRQMLKYAGKYGELVFLYDNESNVLVEEYYTLYQSRCCAYVNSFHHFDYEKVILSKMEKSSLLKDGQPFINYDFIDSKQNKMIQASDVFVGLMGKLFSFLDDASFEKIKSLKRIENKDALENLAKINSLMNRSVDFHKMMIQNVNDVQLTQERMLKMEFVTKDV